MAGGECPARSRSRLPARRPGPPRPDRRESRFDADRPQATDPATPAPSAGATPDGVDAPTPAPTPTTPTPATPPPTADARPRGRPRGPTPRPTPTPDAQADARARRRTRIPIRRPSRLRSRHRASSHSALRRDVLSGRRRARLELGSRGVRVRPLPRAEEQVPADPGGLPAPGRGLGASAIPITTARSKTEGFDRIERGGATAHYRAIAFEDGGQALAASAVRTVDDEARPAPRGDDGRAEGVVDRLRLDARIAGPAGCYTAYKLAYSAKDSTPSYLERRLRSRGAAAKQAVDCGRQSPASRTAPTGSGCRRSGRRRSARSSSPRRASSSTSVP